MSPHDPNPDFEAVVDEASALQHQLPWLHLVCVGGTAAALHAGHRYSTDSDHVGETVREQFEEVKLALTDWEGWKTKRIRHAVAILGERHGIRLGIRQQRRRFPLDTTMVNDLWVPTPEETLRIKAWMIVDRRATRDFLDVAALSDLLGAERTADALAPLSQLYDPVGTETATMRFAQTAMTRPLDEDDVDLSAYRGLSDRYRDIEYVLRRVREVAVPALERELDHGTENPAAASSGEPRVTPVSEGQPPAAKPPAPSTPPQEDPPQGGGGGRKV